MKILCISDTHGQLPDLSEFKNVNLVIHGGDICPVVNHTILFQQLWLNDNFKSWARENCKVLLGTFGNHDFIGAKATNQTIEFSNALIKAEGLVYHNTLSIYLSAFQLPFYDWEFNRTESELEKIYAKIPEGVDIIVSHGPPNGYGDAVPRRIGYENVGSHALLNCIDRVKPKYVITGHIHSGYGIYQHNNTKIINASLLNEKYKLVNKPIEIEIEV